MAEPHPDDNSPRDGATDGPADADAAGDLDAAPTQDGSGVSGPEATDEDGAAGLAPTATPTSEEAARAGETAPSAEAGQPSGDEREADVAEADLEAPPEKPAHPTEVAEPQPAAAEPDAGPEAQTQLDEWQQAAEVEQPAGDEHRAEPGREQRPETAESPDNPPAESADEPADEPQAPRDAGQPEEDEASSGGAEPEASPEPTSQPDADEPLPSVDSDMEKAETAVAASPGLEREPYEGVATGYIAAYEAVAAERAARPLRAATRPMMVPSKFGMAARSFWEEVVYPRARVKAALRRAEHHARRFPAASATALALLIGLPFFMYMPTGFVRGSLAWFAFVGTTIFMAVGGPLLLIYAWPVLVVGAIGVSVWVHFAAGAGAFWLGVATVSAMLIFYFATTEVVPFAAAGLLAWLARGAGTIVSASVFGVMLVIFLVYRYRMTGPMLYAGWVALSGRVAAHVALMTLGDAAPFTWWRGPIEGPPGTTLWVLSVATIAGFLVVPKKRRSRQKPDRKRQKSIAEQLPV